MFLKNNSTSVAKYSPGKKECTPSIVTQDVNILGNIVSDGNIDFEGTLNGNIRCNILTIRANGFIKGEVVANTIIIYGKVRGLIRAKNVQLHASCNVEGIIMHENVTIEDGAFIDGKFKRTDKVQSDEDDNTDTDFAFDDVADGDAKILENIRLIR